MGANPRSTVGTATDANAMLRILFSRLGPPHVGSPQAFSFNVASVSGAGAVTTSQGRSRDQGAARVQRHRRHVPALRGPRSGQRHRPHRAVRRREVAQRGRPDDPGLHDGRLVRPDLRGVAAASTPTSRSRTSPSSELDDLLHKEPTKIKVDGINLTYLGLIPQIKKSFLSKDVDAMQPHVRAFVERAVDLHDLPRLRRHPAQRGAPGPRRSAARSIADVCAMQISDLAAWVRGLRRAVGGAAARRPAARPSTRSSRSGWATSRLDRPSGTLSGGEAQRTKMIRHLGSALTDVTYVFDEPTIGLHPHDIERMNALLLQLRDKGNTVLVVEHKPEAIAIADHVVDLGPGAGSGGGDVVFEGTVEGLRGSDTLTGRHLDDRAGAQGRPCGRATGCAGGARRRHPQPAGRRRRRARSACSSCVTGVAGLGQELADPRLGRRPRRRGRDRPGRHQGLAAQQPRDVHRPARADPQGLRQGQRRQARAVQRQLRGRLPDVQGRRRHLHRPRRSWPASPTPCEVCEGKRFDAVGARLHARRRATSARCWRCRSPRPRSSSPRATRGAGRAPDPRPAGRRRPRLPHASASR